MTSSLEDLLACIRAACPHLSIQDSRLHNTDGQFNEIVIVNNALVFRFPRSQYVAETLGLSVRLMDYLISRLPVPIPALEFRNLEPALGRVFVGYRMLPGVLLRPATLAGIQDPAIVSRLADQAAQFLECLHQTRTDELGLALPVHDRPEEWAQLFVEFQTHLFPHMRADARASVAQAFERYLSDRSQGSFVPVLRHGDFGPGNILYNPATRSLGGVIDFDSVGLGDPAADAAAILNLGNPFFDLMCRTYPDLAAMRTRADFYRGTFALQEALYGLRDGVAEAFEAGIAGYR